MFNLKQAAPKENKTTIDTIIGIGTIVSGTLTSSSSIRVDGEWQGDIKVEGTLTIGKEGKVEGEIVATNVFIEGLVIGNIEAGEHLLLSSTAKVVGDIQSTSLEIETGAHFEGKSIMRHDQKIEQANNQKRVKHTAKQEEKSAVSS